MYGMLRKEKACTYLQKLIWKYETKVLPISEAQSNGLKHNLEARALTLMESKKIKHNMDLVVMTIHKV